MPRKCEDHTLEDQRRELDKNRRKTLSSKFSNTLSALEPKAQGTQNRARNSVEPPKEGSRRGYGRRESIGDGSERWRGEE